MKTLAAVSVLVVWGAVACSGGGGDSPAQDADPLGVEPDVADAAGPEPALDDADAAGPLPGPDVADAAAPDPEPLPTLWLQVRENLQPEANIPPLLQLLDRAAAAGYGGVVLADFKLHLLHREGLRTAAYPAHLAQVLEHAAGLGLVVVPAIFPFGYSEGILSADPNMAESLRVEGTSFIVSADGGSLELQPADIGFVGGGLDAWSAGTPDGWSWVDERVVEDTGVKRSGAASARIDAGSGNARLNQALSIPPTRQVHVSFWMRTEGLSYSWFNAMLYDPEAGLARNFDGLSAAANQDWTRYDLTATRGDAGPLTLYLGLWDGSQGTAWIDDVVVEETALVNLVRRDGAPLVLEGPAGPLVEGVDVDPVSDPGMGGVPYAGNYDRWHEPPTVTLPGTTSLGPGDLVTAAFEFAQPVNGYQVGACLSAPAVDTWMTDNAAAVAEAFAAAPGFFLGYDEMRHGNSCSLCAGRGLSAGALVADHVQRSAAILRGLRPESELFYWSDVFDPNHNAHDGYYLVEGDLAGAWEGLPADAVVVNWLRTAESVAWFEGRGHRQILAGYYDTGDGAASAASDLAVATPSVVGFMYTTWQDDYDELETYAAQVVAGR